MKKPQIIGYYYDDEKGETLEEIEQTSYTYDELLSLSFKLLLNSDYYQKEKGLWIDKSDNEEYMKSKISQAETIKVVGLIKQNEQSVASSSVTSFIGYNKKLKEYVIEKSNEAGIVQEQKQNENINVFTGLEFVSDDETPFDFNTLTNEQKMAMSNLSTEQMMEMMETYTNNKNATYENNLIKLGAIDIDTPTTISIYPKDFDSKDNITNAIEKYNQKQRDEGKMGQ